MNVAFIPARGGSKSIPLKNIKKIGGKPLLYWTCKAACSSEYIDKVYVATDSDIIKQTVDNLINDEPYLLKKICVIGRSAESASDTASTESAMLEFADEYDFDNIILIQATSPLLTGIDIDNGFKKFGEKGTDSVLSVVRQKRFNWEQDEEGIAHPINYDVNNRPRRQEFDGYFVENGAFYITSKDALIKSRNRLSGNIRIVEMSEESYFEIDEPSDFKIIENLMSKKKGYKIDFSRIKMFISDCDGCLTDGGMYYSENGDELKKFNTRDGVAFSILKKKGILIGIITGEKVDLNRRRVEKMGLDIYIAGCRDKKKALEELSKKYEISLDQILFVGDELNDIEAMKCVGIGCCPVDACNEIKEIADIVTDAKGGSGVIREVVRWMES